MNIKQSAVIVGSLALVLGAGMASAAFEGGQQRGDQSRMGGPSEEVRQAIENNDFAAWQDAVSERGPFMDNATEEVFNKMVEMHTLHEAGDMEGARAIHEQMEDELGVEFHERGRHKEGMRGNPAVMEAVDAGDYNAWKAAVEAENKGPFVNNTTESVFTTLQEIHTLREAGDHEAAEEMHENLMDELGFEKPEFKEGMRKGKHMHNHDDFEDSDSEEDDD